jgi:multiple sugar transport system substrate-binding protein
MSHSYKQHALSLIIFLSLVACGTTGSSNPQTSSQGSGTVTLEPATINFWTGFGLAINDELGKLIERFESLHPGVDVIYESKGGYDGLQTAINLSVAESQFPNVAIGYPDHFAGYISSNIQLPLDNFINGSNGVDLDDFISDYLVENQTLLYRRNPDNTFDNTRPFTMGLPFNKSTEVMTYNETFMNWLNSIDSSIVVPTTWQQLQTIGPKILTILNTGNNGNTFFGTVITLPNNGGTIDLTSVNATNFRPFSYDSQANFFITALRQWGGLYTEMGSDIRSGSVKFNNPKTIEMLTFFKNLFDARILGIPYTWSQPYASTSFIANQTIMTVGSSAGVGFNVPGGARFKIGVAPIPYNGVTNQKYVISQGTNLAMFNRGSDAEKAASWALIKYLTTEVNDEFGATTSYFPVTLSMVNSEYYQGFLNVPDNELSSREVAAKNAAVVNNDIYSDSTQSWVKFTDPAFVGSSTIRLEVGFIFQTLFYEQNATPQSVLNFTLNKLNDFI